MILTKCNIKSVNIDALVDEKIHSGKVDELLILVPTNRKLRHLKKDVISSVPGKTTTSINIETIGTIATKLLEVTRRFVQLSEAAATILIKQSASKVELNYFSSYKGEIPHGTLDRVKNVISEYKKHGITPTLLNNEADKLQRNEKLKALDIAAVYKVYLDKCKALKALEIGDIYRELIKLPRTELANNFRRLFPGVDLIVINGFNEFTSPEVEIIEFLSSIGGTQLFLNFDYYLYNPMIFSHLDKCYEKFEKKGFNKIEDMSEANESSFKSSVRENLFLKTKSKKETKYSDKIIKISAVNREEEIELIAKEIKNLISEEKVEAHKICVAFNLITGYSPIIRDKFASYGIPFNLTDRVALDNSLPVTAIINFLEILESDFYYKNIFRAISSGFIDTGNIDAANLMKISSTLKIVVGFENWQNSINDAVKNLKYCDDNIEDVDYKKKKYEKALTDIKKLHTLLKPFTPQMSIPDFLANLEKFVFDIKLFSKLLENSRGKEEENIKSVSTLFETVTEIFNLLQQEYGNDRKFTLKFYLDQIRTACGWARFNVKEKSDYGVLVTTLEEIRGLNFSHLFIGGFCDGDFPTRYNPEIFFSGSYVKQEIIHQTEERYKFYQSLCSWNKRLYLSNPVSQAGKDLVESIFLRDFTDSFDMKVKTKLDYEDVILSTEEFLKYTGAMPKENINILEADLLNKQGIEIDNLSKAIAVDNLRMSNSTDETIYTGYLQGVDPLSIVRSGNGSGMVEDYSPKIAARIPDQFSISQLENYASCPFKYFVERILKLETVEEPVEEIEAMEMGNILHSILFKYYSVLKEKNITLQNIDPDNFKEAEDILFNVAEEEIESVSFVSPLSFYEKEKLLGLNGNKKDSILYKFFESEIQTYDGYIPSFFEVAFGRIKKSDTDKELSSEEPINIDGVKLRGKIDRLEINKDEKMINIVDYKLGGSKPRLEDLWEGISLQLPLYLYAAQKLLLEKFGDKYDYNKMFIYSLKYAAGKFGKNNVSISRKKNEEPELLNQLIAKTLESIKNYVNSISKGKFNLSKLQNKEEKVCRFCNFKFICRVGESD